jgi:SlyX protein
MTEDRLIDIEIKITHQEDALQELNKVVYQQQKKIDHLEAICDSLINHIKELSEVVSDRHVAHEKPPHY